MFLPVSNEDIRTRPRYSTRPYRLVLECRQRDWRGNEPRGCVLHNTSEPIAEMKLTDLYDTWTSEQEVTRRNSDN